MRIKETNRLFEVLREDGHSPDAIADCLTRVVGEGNNFEVDEDEALFDKNMREYFPDPFSRAIIMKRLLLSCATEEVDEDDEEQTQIEQESNYFFDRMLESIAEMLEQTDSLESGKAMLTKLIEK